MLLSFPYLFEVRALFCWPSPQDLFFGPSHLIRFTLFCTFSGWDLIFLTLWSDSLQPATLFFWPSNLLFFTLLFNSEPAGAFPDPLSLFSQPFLLLVWTFRPHFFNPHPLFFQPCPLIFSTFPRFFLTVGIWNSCFMLLCTAGPSLCWFWFVSFFFLSFLNSTALFFHPFIWFVLFLFLRFPSGVLTFLTLSSRLILYPVIWLVSSCSVLFSGLALFLPCMQPKTLFVDRFFSYFRAGGCIFLTSASCFYKPSSCLSGSFDRIFSTLTPFFFNGFRTLLLAF